MSRTWKILIALSLVLNLFLLGASAGMLVVGAKVLSERGERRGGDRVSAAFQALPPDRRQALREIMREQARAAGPDMREAATARREAAQLISMDPYDAAAVTAALARARAAEARAGGRIDTTLAQRLAELSPQERALFARVVTRGPGRGGPGRGGPDGRRGDRPRPPLPEHPAPPAR